MVSAELSAWPWEPGTTPHFEHSVSRARDTRWQPAASAALERCDLGLGEASGGALGAIRLRPAAGTAQRDVPWHSTRSVFEFVYVIAGSAVLETPGAESHLLERGSTAQFSSGGPRRLRELSPEFEALALSVPAEPELRWLDRDELIEAEAGRSEEPLLTTERADAYVLGEGPRAFFSYRDLGTVEPTGGRIKLQVIRNRERASGTGWHYHSMSQWVIALEGTVAVRVEEDTNELLGPLDVLTIGSGPGTRHNVGPISGGYACIELCTPATYDTIPVPEPTGADPTPAGGAA